MSKLASSSFDFKPLYAAIAKEGFHFFRVVPIEKVDWNFLDSEGRFALNLFNVVASQLERKWMSILHTFFPRDYTLGGKSNNRRSPRVHKASAMLWRKGSKPSFAHPNNKVWVPVNVLPNVAVSLPPPTLPVSEETGSPSDDVQPNHSGVPHLSPHRIFGHRDYKRLVFLSSLMSQGKFSIVFLSKYKTKNFVRMLLLLSEFSPSVLGLYVGHALQLSKILSIFIKRNVLHSFSSSASFLGRDLIISVFVSSRMDGLNLSSILDLPSVLDCLPPFVRKFWSPPLVAWKYVKTSGQEFFNYGALGRSVRASQVNKNYSLWLCLFRFPSFVDSHHGHVISANLNILSRPSLIELFSRGTKFRSGFLSMLSIEEAIDKGLKKFVNKQEELLGVQGILSEWKAKVLLFVQKRTCASFVVQTSSDSSLSVPLGDLDHLKILQQSFVITYMDKCCNNFLFVCKKFYVSSVFSELNSPVGAYEVSNLAQSVILKSHLSFNKAHNFKGVKCGPRLLFLCAVWKFHKNPIKPRFICAASSSSLTDVSKWLCSFFKAMFPTVNDLWVQMFLVIVVGFSMTLQEWWR